MKTVMLTGYNSTIAKEFIKIVRQDYPSARIVKCGRSKDADINVDFSKLEQCRFFCETIVDDPPDYLFLNHGVLAGEKLRDLNNIDITQSLNVNLVSMAMILENISDIENLRTVVMSSISGKVGSYDTLYAATKAGIDVLVKSNAQILPPSSRLNAVSPGIISDARMTTVRSDLNVLAKKKSNTPTRQFTTSKEVAQLVSFILFVTENMLGENINLNGGMYVQ